MSNPPAQVELAPEFVRRLKHLLKRYRHAYEDAQALIEQLEQGKTPGDQVQGTGYPVYKVRVRNSDLSRGKSGGYRAIYYIRMPQQIILITIYAKTEYSDISHDEIRRLIDEFEQSKD